MSAPQRFDVLIAGGGMVGAATALALRHLGLRVGVIESRPAAVATAAGYDDRATALSAGSQRMLSALGLWDGLEPHAAAIRTVHVSAEGKFGTTELKSTELAIDALGWVVENPVLQRAFDTAVAAASWVELVQPATVTDVTQSDDEVTVTLGDGRELHARLLVGADGAQSTVRTLVDIAHDVHDYGQTALVANFTPTLTHAERAWERFTADGPFAMLPLPDDRCALVWTAAAARADALLALDDAAFAVEVERLSGGRLGRVLRVGKRQAWPLRRVFAAKQRSGRVVLVGNAAHSLHPIAGQGLNLSLRDVAALVDVLPAALDAPGVLQAWADSRRADQRRVSGFTDCLNSLFQIELPAMGALRAAGLAAFGINGPLRRWFARYAAGVR